MELEEGLGYAMQGRAVLFLGAGFSYGATSLSGDKLLLGQSLGKALADEVGVSDQFALEDIADIFLTNLGGSALLSRLRFFFTAKEVTSSHKEIAKIPWRIVYTTNYDDVFRAGLRRGWKTGGFNQRR